MPEAIPRGARALQGRRPTRPISGDGCVAVVGGCNPLGYAVASALSELGRHVFVVGVPQGSRDLPASIELLSGRLGDDMHRERLAHASTLILLAGRSGPDIDGTSTGGVDLDLARRSLDAAEEVSSVVVLSSAMAYGAREDNPVPLTEESRLRPNAGVDYAVERAELERMVAEWCADREGVSLAILRPTLTLAEDSVDWMARSLWHRANLRHGESDPPAQFLHRDDLVSAVVLAAEDGLEGAFNVAPEGWLSASEVDDLAGPRPKVRLTAGVASRLAGWRWRHGLTSTPPEVLPYTQHPWVVASDRLRAAGWKAGFTNAETYVVAHRPGTWSSLSSQRRQKILLGLLGLAGAAGVAGIVVAVRRLRARELNRS